MDEPISVRSAMFPPQYGEAGSEADLLPWSFVEERLRSAPNCWVTTVTPDGRPHARQVDGVWVGGALCFGGSERTRCGRNMEANAAVSVHLASNTEVVILEGSAERVLEAAHPLAAPSAAASHENYPQYYPDEAPPFRPFWLLRPRTVYAWTLEGFPRGAVRWSFGDR